MDAIDQFIDKRNKVTMLCQNLGDDRFKYGEVGKGLCQEMEIKLLPRGERNLQ